MSRLSALLKPSGDFGNFHWQINTWSQLKEGASAVRESVFIKEQLVPIDIEMDDKDLEAVHILVTTQEGLPVATARMIKGGESISHLGRMSVILNYRGNGLGHLMLVELMRFARRRRDLYITLNAQSHAIGFYKKHGFEMEGDPFLEANLPHIKMSVDLTENEFALTKN